MKLGSMFVIASALLLAACGPQIPPLNFAPPNVGMSETRLDMELRSLIVSLARPDEQVGEIDVVLVESAGTQLSTGGGITQLWEDALEESLNRMVIFTDGAETKVNLMVRVLKLDVPVAGFEFETETIARYELMDRATGDILFTTDIASSGVTPADYAFMGVVRARESANRSVQNNITQFLQQLETVDGTAPMFPAPQPTTPAVGLTS